MKTIHAPPQGPVWFHTDARPTPDLLQMQAAATLQKNLSELAAQRSESLYNFISSLYNVI